jgi:hypothetical protein
MVELQLAQVDRSKITTLADVGFVPEDLSHQSVEYARVINNS